MRITILMVDAAESAMSCEKQISGFIVVPGPSKECDSYYNPAMRTRI